MGGRTAGTGLPLVVAVTLLCAAALACVRPAEAQGAKAYVFNQTLDHFNFQVKQYFGQNYYVNDQYWNRTGPVFFYVGAETPTTLASSEYLVTSQYAQQTGGLVVAAEHRYYGTSRPFGMHPTPEQYGWLTIEQALADYAVIVLHVKEMYNTSNPVYCFGGSYGGLLSALLRIKYGNVFWGSIASAAPILGNRANPETWFSLVSRSYVDHDYACALNIHTAFQTMAYKLSQTQDGRDRIARAFGLCPNVKLETSNNVTEALWWGQWAFSFISEFNYPYPALYSPTFTPPLPHACDLINNGPDELIERVGKAVRFGFNVSFSPVECFNSTDLWGTGAARVLEVEQWTYELCTAVVLPSGSDGINDLFSAYSWDYYFNEVWKPFCAAKFGTTPDPNYIEKYLVGTGLESYSRIIFTSATFDPARGFSPLQNVSSDLLAFIYVGGHTQDIQLPYPGEDPSLTTVRAQILDVLMEWTREYKPALRKMH